MGTRFRADKPLNYHELLTLAQVAARVERSERTVWRWIREGQLQGVRLGGRWFVTSPVLSAYLSAADADTKVGA